jgi:hypothetical protein
MHRCCDAAPSDCLHKPYWHESEHAAQRNSGTASPLAVHGHHEQTVAFLSGWFRQLAPGLQSLYTSVSVPATRSQAYTSRGPRLAVPTVRYLPADIWLTLKAACEQDDMSAVQAYLDAAGAIRPLLFGALKLLYGPHCRHVCLL